MKVSVITFLNLFNYGSVLQAFATQEKFKNYFDEVELINYTKPSHTSKHILKKIRSKPAAYALFLPTAFRWNRMLSNFHAKHSNFSEASFSTEESFNKFPLHDGIYCTGSDQIWNLEYNRGVVPHHFLSFVPPGSRKFAYAASFGSGEVSEKYIEESKPLIQQYEKISVRESNGANMLKEQYGYNNAIRLIDPTLAMPPEFWRKFAPKPKIKEDYILIYNLNYSKAFDNYAKELSKKTGLQVIRLCSNFAQAIKGYGKAALMPQIFEFVTLIDNAKYLLTDSFHGTAFALNLNTEPIVVYPGKFSTRLSDILKLVSAEDRAILNFDNFDILNRHTDFNHVNAIFAKERERTDEFLKSIVQ